MITSAATLGSQEPHFDLCCHPQVTSPCVPVLIRPHWRTRVHAKVDPMTFSPMTSARSMSKGRPHSEDPGLRLQLSLGNTIQLITDDIRMRVFELAGWVDLC